MQKVVAERHCESECQTEDCFPQPGRRNDHPPAGGADPFAHQKVRRWYIAGEPRGDGEAWCVGGRAVLLLLPSTISHGVFLIENRTACESLEKLGVAGMYFGHRRALERAREVQPCSRARCT